MIKKTIGRDIQCPSCLKWFKYYTKHNLQSCHVEKRRRPTIHVQNEYGKFEIEEGMDDHDICIHHGIHKHNLSLREFYQHPAHEDLKLKETTRRTKKDKKDKKATKE